MMRLMTMRPRTKPAMTRSIFRSSSNARARFDSGTRLRANLATAGYQTLKKKK